MPPVWVERIIRRTGYGRAVSEIAERYRRVAGRFTQRVNEVPDGAWEAPAPCEGWVARDVVRHLVEWIPAFLTAAGGPSLPAGPSVDVDPAGAWAAVDAGIQALLDDPVASATEISHPRAGTHRLDEAIATFFLGDVVVHTWDVARAAGLDETLDADVVHEMLVEHGAPRRDAARQRPVRPQGRGPGLRRRADAAHRLHGAAPLTPPGAQRLAWRPNRKLEASAASTTCGRGTDRLGDALAKLLTGTNELPANQLTRVVDVAGEVLGATSARAVHRRLRPALAAVARRGRPDRAPSTDRGHARRGGRWPGTRSSSPPTGAARCGCPWRRAASGWACSSSSTRRGPTTCGPSSTRWCGVLVLVLISKRRYTDVVVRSRRSERLSPAAELQWDLLPPLTCSTAAGVA